MPDAPACAPAARGRPPSITRERIAAAGLGLGLANITFVGMAAALGVSQMALYKHVASLEALKRLVAEEAFARWQIPPVSDEAGQGLEDYLNAFIASLRGLVKASPGLMPYLLRPSAATPTMLEKIDAHHRQVAKAHGISRKQARWLLATLAFHCIAAADSVYSLPAPDAEDAAARAEEARVIEAEFDEGMRVLIAGALALLKKG